MTTETLSRDEAITAVHEAAWIQYDYENATCGHRGCQEHPNESRKRIHSLSEHGFGADWDLDKAEDFISRAVTGGWVGTFSGHHLRVVGEDGRVIYFEVKQPGDAA
jgi:hypothetical protein